MILDFFTCISTIYWSRGVDVHAVRGDRVFNIQVVVSSNVELYVVVPWLLTTFPVKETIEAENSV